MMGPKLAQISHARTYASVAGNQEVEAIHKVSFHDSIESDRNFGSSADVISKRISLSILGELLLANAHMQRLLGRLLLSLSEKPMPRSPCRKLPTSPRLRTWLPDPSTTRLFTRSNWTRSTRTSELCPASRSIQADE
jgi:hypothetical protein